MSFQFLILVLFSFVWLGLIFYILKGMLGQTPFYPSNRKKLKNLYKDIKGLLPKNPNFVDIGSGDGRIVAWASNKGMNATGIESNPYLTLLSRLILLITRSKGKIINANFFKINYSKYNVVYLYIFPEHMNKLKDKLFNELPKHSLIISNVFTFKDVKPHKISGVFKIYLID